MLKKSYTLSELSEVAAWVLDHAGTKKLWCFFGEMGAGKTTLIKEICKQFGLNQNVSSPTFSLVNEYTLLDGKTLYHFDFYRIKTIEEVYDIGYEDYFESGNICLIEWPEMIEEILEGESFLEIRISKENEFREIEIIEK
ncbi:MAG: tRNA (adenosine(37)-N6)-threonylcarbamoyltransferase complex ATPase subunit type 1 TsaE [Bacteroidia bacterium]|nr:tRNA (adenosine(37)-N6)-threonylcarbamoyltransferase complex ATPase subunit type 1 TsaE [Bacteroidia bacterium]